MLTSAAADGRERRCDSLTAARPKTRWEIEETKERLAEKLVQERKDALMLYDQEKRLVSFACLFCVRFVEGAGGRTSGKGREGVLSLLQALYAFPRARVVQPG